MFGKVSSGIIRHLIEELKKEDNQNKLKTHCIDPLIYHILDKLYPYIIITFVIFVLILLIVFLLLLMAMRSNLFGDTGLGLGRIRPRLT